MYNFFVNNAWPGIMVLFELKGNFNGSAVLDTGESGDIYTTIVTKIKIDKFKKTVTKRVLFGHFCGCCRGQLKARFGDA